MEICENSIKKKIPEVKKIVASYTFICMYVHIIELNKYLTILDHISLSLGFARESILYWNGKQFVSLS